MSDFKPAEILAVLDRHEVEYVLIGGLAAILYGAPHLTTDADIVPAVGRSNLDRLSAALTELGARIRVKGEPEGIPFGHDGESLGRVQIWNLVTTLGDLDITFTPNGTQGYDDLRRDRRWVLVGDIQVPVASLADVIRSKEAADRERDRAILPVLREMLERERSRRSGRQEGA